MGSPPLEKNGRDHLQDKAIEDVQRTLDRHSRVFERFRQDEENTHAALGDGVRKVTALVERYIFAGRIAWAFLGILGTIVIIYQASLNHRINEFEARLDDVAERVEGWIPFATKWGNDIDSNAKRNDAASKERHEAQEKKIDDLNNRVRILERKSR